MAISVPPFVSITFLSESNALTTSEANVFISSSYTGSGFAYNVLSSSITYNTGSGHFTASEGGNYQIILNSIWGRAESFASPGTTDYDRTIKFYKNDSLFYSATARYDYGDYASGSERTFHAVVSMSANDGIKITSTSTAAKNSFLSGSNLIIRKIDSDFAYTLKKTVSTALTGTVVNYFSGSENTDFTTASSGMTVTPDLNTGSFTVQSTGSYYTFFTNILDDTSSGDNWMTESLNVGSFPGGGFSIAERTLWLDTATATDQRTLINLSTVDGTEVPAPIQIQATTDTNGATGFITRAGTAITMMKIPRNAIMPISFNSATSSYISTSSNSNLLSSSFIQSSVEDLSVLEMTFNSGSGIITIPSGGYYHLSYNIKIYNSNASIDAGVQFQVRRGCTNCTDGTVIYQGRTSVGAVTDPINYTLTTIISASDNDTLTLCARDYTTSGGEKVYIDVPSWFYLYRIDTYIPPADLYPFNETAGSSSYTSNYTINTYLRSNQYERATEQVPFYLGTPGVLSVRGRTTTGSVTSTD